MLSRALDESETRILQRYRRAAGRVFEWLGHHAAHKFQARILRKGRPDEADFIPEADFIALLVAFRVVYAVRESTHFGRVANLLYKVGNDEIRSLVVQLRDAWLSIPKRSMLISIDEEHFDPGAILDTWMNGEVFHQDEHLLHRVDLLKDLGPFAQLMLQWTVRDMCFPLLGLDNVCAMALGEELRPLPDVSSASSNVAG